jgi:hypothetical protein
MTNYMSEYLAAIRADNSLTQESKDLITLHISNYLAYCDARDNPPKDERPPASNILSQPNYKPGSQPTASNPMGTQANPTPMGNDPVVQAPFRATTIQPNTPNPTIVRP